MIDTDKYENITPESWTVDEEDLCRVVDVQECTIARTDFVDIDEEREWQLANAQLIADAPLILDAYNKKCKEVERLREALQIITKDLDSAIAQGHIPIRATNGIDVTKIRNFANDASL